MTSANAGALTGDALYRVVDEYAALGEHRTGTDVDLATAEWLGDLLRGAGAEVEVQTWDFPRYDASWSVQIDGADEAAVPLFYEGVGREQSSAPFVARVAVGGADRLRGFGDVVDSARRSGRGVAVVATEAGSGRLFAVNREPFLGSGLLTLCVAGTRADVLIHSRVDVRIEAAIVPGVARNVLGRFGQGEAAPILVTTPLSGWFRCAGERGTGIAIALALAEALSASGPVLFVGTSGHELGYLGSRHALASLVSAPRAVVHVGASVGAAGCPPNGKLAPAVRGFVSEQACDRANVEAAFAQSGREVLSIPRGGPGWVGEAITWAQTGSPMLSIAGPFGLFHTPEDRPEAATSPELLALAFGEVLAAAERCFPMRPARN